MNAADMMHPADADIHVDHNLHEAQARFDASGRDRILVLDGDEVVGTLHRGDLPEDQERWRQLTVQEIMPAAPLPTCGPQTSAEAVRGMLEAHAFVLVLDDEREIVGIVERGGAAACPTPQAGKGGTSPDPTGGRATLDEDGRLHVYSDKPHVRRLREAR